MKFKKLEWHEVRNEEHTTIFGDGVGFVTAIVFEDFGEWHLHYENRDSSEHITSAESKEAIKDLAQEFHNANVAKEFFDEE
jgi:hypothetical protein